MNKLLWSQALESCSFIDFYSRGNKYLLPHPPVSSPNPLISEWCRQVINMQARIFHSRSNGRCFHSRRSLNLIRLIRLFLWQEFCRRVISTNHLFAGKICDVINRGNFINETASLRHTHLSRLGAAKQVGERHVLKRILMTTKRIT